MAGKCKEMSTIKQVIRLHMDGMKNREIARVLGIYKGTVNKYVSKAEADTMSMEELLSLDDPVLECRMNSGKLAAPDRRFDELSRRLDHIASELSRPKSHEHGVQAVKILCCQDSAFLAPGVVIQIRGDIAFLQQYRSGYPPGRLIDHIFLRI